MTIGILTTFYDLNPAYSLCSVVRDQLIAGVKHGHKMVLFVLPSFKDTDMVPDGVEIRKIVPQYILEPYKELNFPSDWEKQRDECAKLFVQNMQDIDVLFAHDIFFIDTYLPYNLAMREALPKLRCKVLAWTHSAPSSRPLLENNPHASRYTIPEDRFNLVYLNNDKANDLAEMYGTWLDRVHVVNNPRDPRSFWNLHPLVKRILGENDVLSADIISVYPLSTPRMVSGKGLDKAIRIHAKLKELGYTTRFIVANAHANAEREKQSIATLLTQAKQWGLDEKEVIFTSLLGQEYEQGIPYTAVSDLFRLSNIFIFPTISENCSLIMLEAMMSGNLMVMNKKVRSFLEFCGGQALYMEFDSRTEDSYYLDLAKIIAAQFLKMKPLQVKRMAFQKYNYDAIWNDQIEPLLYE